MREEVRAWLKPRQEEVAIAGRKAIVRELPTAADGSMMADDIDIIYKLTVLSVFDAESGEPVFEMADIPELKESAKTRMIDVIQAVQRVNGLDIPAIAKNSDAGPNAG